ncbi:MAG TPA: hypothetical protein VIR98_01600 [Candidatus Paceibacterota bacterium]|jgi:hypothetical protein
MNTRKGPDMIETSFRIEDREMPAHVHSKVMKRVFFAAYGKYLYASAAVLVLNLAVLGKEVWRALREVDLTRALHPAPQLSFVSALSWDSIIAVIMSTLLCAATAVVLTKIYRDAKAFGMFRA